MPKTRIVIVAYRPRPGKEEELESLLKDHVPLLRAEGLATDRPSVVMRAGDGTVVEVFEWTSKAAIEAAHANEKVQRMWTAFAQVCEYVPVGHLEETGRIFSEFTPVN